MQESESRIDLQGRAVHFVGAKGTGMAALAEIFSARGARLSGSDSSDSFYTDAIIKSLGMMLFEGFAPSHVPEDAHLVIYSDAYPRSQNPELLEADRRGIPIMSYAEALGLLSRSSRSSAISGVHGKTTTTAMAGTILKEAGSSATVLAGSAVSSFKGRCTHIGGDDFLVAETDEYRGHFFHYRPERILLTAVESDHQDYYPTYESIRDAFVDFATTLPQGGILIACADDSGAMEVARLALAKRPDIVLQDYGLSAQGPWKIEYIETREGESRFRITCSDMDFRIKIPGKHAILDAVGALALSKSVCEAEGKIAEADFWKSAYVALEGFRGSKRRSEILGEAGGILFVDDYAHHPTALSTTISGYKSFWPSRRLIVDFMSHTYSRTLALLDDFAASLSEPDCVILHGIYASAREIPSSDVTGRSLYDKVRALRPDLEEISPEADAQAGDVSKMPLRKGFILYTERHAEALDILEDLVRPGDLFVTMGAGDNWKLGKALMRRKGGT
ncbi:MAG TPA: UDP-N-acetylmuramate--L-alanine ligase [Rectinemataceae bacterium]